MRFQWFVEGHYSECRYSVVNLVDLRWCLFSYRENYMYKDRKPNPIIDPLILILRFSKTPTGRGQDIREGVEETGENYSNAWSASTRHGETKVPGREFREPEAGCFLAGLNKVCPRLSKYSKDSAWPVLRPPSSLSLSLSLSHCLSLSRSFGNAYAHEAGVKWHERMERIKGKNDQQRRDVTVDLPGISLGPS